MSRDRVIGRPGMGMIRECREREAFEEIFGREPLGGVCGQIGQAAGVGVFVEKFGELLVLLGVGARGGG